MRKKIPSPRVAVSTPDPAAVLSCGDVTPEMEDVLKSMEGYTSASHEETAQFFRDAVGKLFIAALQQMYRQQHTSTF